MKVNEIADDINKLACDNGWWDPPDDKQATAHRLICEHSKDLLELASEIELIRQSDRTTTPHIHSDDALTGREAAAFLFEMCESHQLEATKLMLIGTEVAEAVEAFVQDPHHGFRVEDSGKPEGFGVEVVDVIIRALDFLVHKGLDPAAIIQAKHDYNKTRSRRHGGKLA